MRENLSRLQQVSLRMCGNDESMTKGQTECLRVPCRSKRIAARKDQAAMSSLDQADAEDELASWLEDHGIENSWKAGCDHSGGDRLRLPRRWNAPSTSSRATPLSDPLNWIEALISSVQLVGTIEESVSRVTDLVGSGQEVRL